MIKNKHAELNHVFEQPRYLWFLILAYSMIFAISDWFDVRLIEIFGFAMAPGTLSFPLTFLLSDTITEVYGYKHARRAIWAALLFNIIFLLYGQVVVHLPSPSFATENAAFDKILAMNARIVAGSFISYLIAEPLNSYMMAKLKIITNGQFMGIRFVVSTIIAALIDTVFFIFIAFYGVYNTNAFTTLILNIWCVKVIIELFGLPFSIRLTKWLKKKERYDMYDYQTNFNPFSLNTDYRPEDNLYREEKI